MGILTVLICAQGYKGFCTVCITNPRITRQQVVSNRYHSGVDTFIHMLIHTDRNIDLWSLNISQPHVDNKHSYFILSLPETI